MRMHPHAGRPALLGRSRGVVAQADKINTMLKAAGVTVEPYWPALFAKTLAVQKLDALITNVGSGAYYLACGPGG